MIVVIVMRLPYIFGTDILEVTQILLISSVRLSHSIYEIIGWSEELCLCRYHRRKTNS